jgi:hypothetical protein
MSVSVALAFCTMDMVSSRDNGRFIEQFYLSKKRVKEEGQPSPFVTLLFLDKAKKKTPQILKL